MHLSHGLCTAVTPKKLNHFHTKCLRIYFDDRLPKQLLYGELCYGKRSFGGQNKRFKDTLKKTLSSFNIDATNWEVCAQDRPLWCSMIHSKNSRNNQDRGGSEKARCSQSDNLLSYHLLNQADIPMPRMWKSAAGPNWTD